MEINSSSEQPRWLFPRSTYVHIPFCAFHCGYCDFAVSTGQEDRMQAYLDALEKEIETLEIPKKVETIFIGGGTPTYLPEPHLERLLGILKNWLPILPGGEFRVEANPGSLTREKVDLLADHGVNRISLGGQSFQPHLLKVLERDHQPVDLYKAVDLARDKIEIISIDLIFGIPGQTLAQWQEDLRSALKLCPDHLSTYGLTFEKGTRLWKDMRRGGIQPLAEEMELAMYQEGMATLLDAGFNHYEISNFSKPGKECRHNHVYWANEAHYGFGMGAAAYVQGTRAVNSRDLSTYIRKAMAKESTRFQSETLNPEGRALETLGQNLRRARGINRADFQKQTGFDVADLAGPTMERFLNSGHLAREEDHLFLTNEGKCVADTIIQKFWESAPAGLGE